ncbi:MAG: FHA domain-containing protein [Verrucomicrobiae bacterium]|nr:FHA domain-containing protein [Verrucomicrobiae bacterium]
MALLIYKDTGGRYFDFIVPSKPFTIGRSTMADVSIPDDERMSRVHCEIRREGGHYYIRDLDSKNGTWVNQERIKKSQIKFGDKIKVGHTILAFDS